MSDIPSGIPPQFPDEDLPTDGEVPIEAPPYDDANPNPPTEQFFGRSIN